MDKYLKAFQLKLLFRVMGWHKASAHAQNLIVNQLVVTISKICCRDNSYLIVRSDWWGMLEYNSRAFLAWIQARQDRTKGSWRGYACLLPDFLRILPEQLTLNQFECWKSTSARQILFLAVLHYYFPKRTSLHWSACGEPLLADDSRSVVASRWQYRHSFPLHSYARSHYRRIGSTVTLVLLPLLSRPFSLTL